jgi:hypothetical protein
MRKAIFLLFVALGAAAGLLATLEETWGVRILMTAIGTVVGIAIGGFLSKIGVRRGPAKRPSAYLPFPQPMFGEDLDRNYWRDRGHLPFTKPPSADPDHHMFDPDKLD